MADRTLMQRVTLESTALAVQEPKQVMVKNSRSNGERAMIRGANGRFVKHTTFSAQKDAKEAQRFLAQKDPETGMSRKQSLREAVYKGAIKAADEPKALGNAVKAVQMFEDESGHTKAKNELLSDQSHIQQPVKIVIIPFIEGIKPMEERPAEKTRPSFADAEVISQNGPSGMLRE
jgi:hypothetical protein